VESETGNDMVANDVYSSLFDKEGERLWDTALYLQYMLVARVDKKGRRRCHLLP
jgi:hypothetical protein